MDLSDEAVRRQIKSGVMPTPFHQSVCAVEDLLLLFKLEFLTYSYGHSRILAFSALLFLSFTILFFGNIIWDADKAKNKGGERRVRSVFKKKYVKEQNLTQ